MKKTFKDIQQNILLKLIKPLVYIWMWLDASRKVHIDNDIKFNRKEPYIMLANHTFLFDVVHVPLRFKITPFIIASQTLFTKQPAKFLVSQVAHVIPKAKGRNDLKTIKDIFGVIKRGYPVLIFPEGNTTFYGETGYIEKATVKLIKRLGLDVITCNVKGGYLSKPRWATGKRRNHRIELFYKKAITKEQIKDMSLNELGDIIDHQLYHNDYDYQREKMIPHPGKKLAEGIENVVYICPHCQSVNTIVSDHNNILCTACKKEGYIDQYGFIHGFKYDNLIDWNKYQRNFTDKLRKSIIESEGFLNFMSVDDGAQLPVGRISIKYQDNEIFITGAFNINIKVQDIQNATITLRRDFGFLYDNKHYLINLDKYGASFLRVVQDKY